MPQNEVRNPLWIAMNNIHQTTLSGSSNGGYRRRSSRRRIRRAFTFDTNIVPVPTTRSTGDIAGAIVMHLRDIVVAYRVRTQISNLNSMMASGGSDAPINFHPSSLT